MGGDRYRVGSRRRGAGDDTVTRECATQPARQSLITDVHQIPLPLVRDHQSMPAHVRQSSALLN